jgi:hypothetical protein
MRMKNVAVLACIALLALLLASCAPGLNEQAHTPNAQGIVAGFWRGLWHGLIAPITFVISLFSKSVQIYEVHNNGGWYNLGFLLGMCVAIGGGPAGRAAKSRR